MRVLADMHHGELYESLRILFEDRLGWELYRSIGIDWYTEGYWMVYDHPDTVTQYLGMHLTENDISENHRNQGATALNLGHTEYAPGIYEIKSPEYDCIYKAITLEAFKNMKFDIVLSSIPSHISRYNTLISNFQPSAKHIFQVGNNWKAPYPEVKNILTSSIHGINSEANCVFYHQEFNLNTFAKTQPKNIESIFNMMHYMQDKEFFYSMKSFLPAWSFKSYGAGNEDGPCSPHITKVAEVFKNSGFVWHVKSQGDGYGYNIHHAFACGRPLVTRVSDFSGMTASSLLVDGETCIDIGNRTPEQVVHKLVEMLLDYPRFSDNVYNKFKSVVNFDQEFKDIKVFMDNLR
jgi:hypothetical protein